ncbi:glutaredoxin family protein [Moraxella oblonga]|uniref:glutaredoxin family protein n=1 Tax=Moraxella oblonga TaxID=200413 RepID=UPI00082DFED9|nr:glutaredoxin family protein [Moraxella oblonga]
MQTTFTNWLYALQHNRFALQALSQSDFYQFYATLLAGFAKTPDDKTWYLIGTEGCHLCEKSMAMINTLNLQNNDINIVELDIMEGGDEIINALGASIPILLTPKTLLCYPFGIMDVLMLLQSQ